MMDATCGYRDFERLGKRFLLMWKNVKGYKGTRLDALFA